jgi:tRNA pseudouridine(55) synthase
MRRATGDFDHRVFVIDKAPGPTSFDVVRRFRGLTRLRKVGHTGTLDPLAGGVLILCTGVATRASEHFVDLEKEYEFTVTLGRETDTLDAEGEVLAEAPVPDIPREHLDAAAAGFVGSYAMTPPSYSAIKRDGKRLYERARSGEAVEVEPRTVQIYAFEVLEAALPDIRCRVRCSRGTYVRSLARDLGRMLDLPAHVTELVRTRIGPFRREDGFDSHRLWEDDVEGLEGHGLGEALSFLPGVVLSKRSGRALLDGGRPGAQDVVKTIGEITPGSSVRILDESGSLLAVGHRNDDATHDRLLLVDSYRLYVDNSAPERA